MLLYDVNSFPEGIDLSVWYDLFQKGLAVYDSKRGVEPFKYDAEDLVLIDINSLSNDDLNIVAKKVDEVTNEFNKKTKDEMDKVLENNRKLVEYLKSINKK
jgi:hypothetical protein